jgi:small subunit ribosomal protein S8
MSLSDPIADMLTRIRNAVRIQGENVLVKKSKICEGIANVLTQEGYILGFDNIDDGKQGLLRINIKYDDVGEPIIQQIKRESKPGRRLYCAADKLPRVLNGLGIAIVSTDKGVLSDRTCRKDKIGGEILCTVC